MNNVFKKEQPQKKRQQYTAMFKAEVVHESELKGISVRDVALKYDIEHSMVVRWWKKKIQMYEDAAETHRRNFKKG